MWAGLTLRCFAVWYRNMLVFRRYLFSNIVTGFVEPLVYLFGMGFGIGAFVRQMEGLPYATYIAPGIIAASAMFNASFESTFGTFIRMKFQKTFDAIIATPVNIEEVVAGEILYGATKAALGGTTILVAIHLFGLLPGFHPLALLVPLVALLLGLLFSVVAVIIAAVVPNIDAFNYYITLALTPMFILSGTFFPVETLPPAMQAGAWFTPLFHGVRLSRELVLGQTTHLMADGVWLLVVTAVLAPLPLWLMRRKLIR